LIIFPALFLVLMLLIPTLRRRVKARPVPGGLKYLLGVPAGIVALQFIALAAGKPGGYGRFALLPAALLCLKVIIFPWIATAGRSRAAYCLIVLLAAIPFGSIYLAHFVADSREPTTRILVAEWLRRDSGSLALVAEPAPYDMPPVDLWRWRLQLLPRDMQ